jgi:hypothetical protein
MRNITHTFEIHDEFIFSQLSQTTKRKEISYESLTKIRIFFILAILIEEAVFWSVLGLKRGFKSKFIYLTEWNHFLCLLLYVILVVKKLDRLPTGKLSSLFHLMISVQFNCNLFYWLFIHKQAMEEVSDPLLIILLFFKHINPPLFMFIDFSFNNIILTRKSRQLILPYSILYLIVNFITVVIFDHPVYKIINYRDFTSYFLFLLSTSISLLFSSLFLKFQEFKYGIKFIKLE